MDDAGAEDRSTVDVGVMTLAFSLVPNIVRSMALALAWWRWRYSFDVFVF